MSDNKQISVIGQICQTIDKMSDTFKESLNGTGITPARFTATAKTAIQTHNDKSKLETADRQSLYLAIRKAASDGLMPDNREAALVCYFNKDKGVNEVQYQPMVQGLVKLARNSGEISSISSEVVFEGDHFELIHNSEGVKFEHKPYYVGERTNPILVWACVKLKSGETIVRALTQKRVMMIAMRSKMPSNYDPAKGKDWEEFWRKAAIRNVLKYAPRSTALDSAIQSDDVEFQEQTIEQKPIVTETPKETKASAKIKEAVKEEQPVIIEAEIIEENFDDAPPM